MSMREGLDRPIMEKEVDENVFREEGKTLLPGN